MNAPQREAVEHTAGPLLVFAGAGSGKTRVITFRIAQLLAAHRVPPYRILAVTFTNKAAREMRERLEDLVGPEVTRDLWVGTFHATCARLLRRYHESADLSRDFVIYDETDQRALMARVLKSLKLDERRYPPRLLLSLIHGHKQHGRGPEDVTAGDDFERRIVEVYTAYQRQLLAANAVDFEDLILHVMRIVEDAESVAGDELRRRFSHVLVDEFQDVNPIQYRLVRALAASHRNLSVVGDDDQSIYQWRGADVRIIRGYQRDFSDAKVIKLEQNYRSTGNIVGAALAVIRPSVERVAKELYTRNPSGEPVRVVTTRTERDEASFVVRVVKRSLEEGTDPQNIAVFYRIHAQSRVLEETFRTAGIPYQVVGGTRFFDRAEIKDVLAYLRVLANPESDVDLLRIINVPTRGIGSSSVERITRTADSKRESLFRVIMSSLDQCGLSKSPAKRVAAFRSLLEGLRADAEQLVPHALAERVLEVTGYAMALTQENTAEADARLENLRELVGSLKEYEAEAQTTGVAPTLAEYLERVSLITDMDQMKDGGRVSMMTVHAAKGLEFDLVIVTGLEEDLFPYRSSEGDPAQLEEERRLGYVALTRARKRLYLTYAHTRTIFGNTRYTQPSWFLSDLPSEVTESQLSPSLASSAVASRMREPARRMPGERYVDHDVVDPPHMDEGAPFRRGAKVVHSKFGTGEVRSIITSTTPPTVVVFFPDWGQRKITAGFLRPA